MKVWDREHPQGGNNTPPNGEAKFPLNRPNWNNNDPIGRQNMEDLRMIIIRGMKEAVPKAQNMTKALNIEQG